MYQRFSEFLQINKQKPMANKAVILQGAILAYLLFLSGGSISGIFDNLLLLVFGEALVLLAWFSSNNGPEQRVEGSIFITGYYGFVSSNS